MSRSRHPLLAVGAPPGTGRTLPRRFAECLMLEANAPYLKQVDLPSQGYALLDVTPEEVVVEFRGLDTFDPDAVASAFASFRVVAGRPGIEVLTPAPA